MARDFDPYDFSVMSDDEIYDIVVQHLSEHPELDAGWIDVTVHDGRVTLAGRVASDQEVQIAEQALVDGLGLTSVVNDLMADELHRGEAPEAGDDAAPRDPLGDQSDTAAHLVENLEAETYGTSDVGTAIEEGTSYEPPH